MRQLEIGPGGERLPGFETLNLVASAVTDHVGDARRPPFADDSFDLVYSSHCLEHIDWYELEATVGEWARIVKPGGWLEVFTVDGLRLMQALVQLEATGEWAGPEVGNWKPDLVGGDPYKWAVGRLLNYPKRSRKGANWLHRAIITPGYLRRCFEAAGLGEIEALTEERGHRHGWISFGLRGRKC